MTVALNGMTDSPSFWSRLQHASGTLMFDIGANGGSTAAMFAEKFDQVYAFEPCKESYEALKNWDLPNVRACPQAVSDHVGTVLLREASNSIRTGQLVTGESDPGWGDTVGERLVDCLTIDYLTQYVAPPTHIKVDVEGHEVQVLQGAAYTLGLYPTWYIEVHSADYLEPLSELLSGYTIDLHRHDWHREGSDGWHNHFYLVAS